MGRSWAGAELVTPPLCTDSYKVRNVGVGVIWERPHGERFIHLEFFAFGMLGSTKFDRNRRRGDPGPSTSRHWAGIIPAVIFRRDLDRIKLQY
jgi:hypothetical protein